MINRAKLQTADSGKWVLLEDLEFETKRGQKIIVPKGFVCDLASIPRILRPLFSVNGKHREAAILHDWLYYKRGRVAFRSFTREQCDEIFYQEMRARQVGQLKARIMWAGVRVGGWFFWYNS